MAMAFRLFPASPSGATKDLEVSAMRRLVFRPGLVVLVGLGMVAVGASSDPATAQAPLGADTGSAVGAAQATNRIAFVQKVFSEAHISLMDRDGGNIVELTGSRTKSPTFTPDGRRIVFTKWTRRGSDLWIIDTDGKHLEQLTTAPVRDADPSVSPDGRLIAFTSDRGAGHGVYVMSATGEVQGPPARRLARGWNPAFAPDGRHILYTRRTDQVSDLWVMQLGGTHRHQLTTSPSNDSDPAYSPDGRRIVYVRDRAIWLMHSDGTRQHAITAPRYWDSQPAFSPNGKQVVFARVNYVRYYNIVRKPARMASHTKVLTKYPHAWSIDDYQPAWWGPTLLRDIAPCRGC